MIEDQKGDKINLNNTDLHINRGFEFMLKTNSKKKEVVKEPKTFLIKFGKIISFLKREVHFNLELSLDIKKTTL